MSTPFPPGSEPDWAGPPALEGRASPMGESAEAVIRAELGPDEQLLWSGQPKQGIVLRATDLFMIPFSLFWGGFAILWELMALSIFFTSEDAPPTPVAIIMPLFGIPFVLIGLYMIFGRFFIDAKRRARTFYGFSEQQVILVSGLFGRKVKSLNLRTLSDLSLNEKADGTGTITFGPTHPMAALFGNMPWPGGPQAGPSFDMIPDAKDVYNRLREAQTKA